MKEGDKLRLSLIQYDIAWENKRKNLEYIHQTLEKLSGTSDLVVLPEMCTTGFSMNSYNLAEKNEENTISTLKEWAKKFEISICGSFIAKDKGNYYNRGFFITPDKEDYYDKRHLFRMGMEPQYFSAGSNRLVVKHKDFNICLLICYDLRFPVWARNIDNEYDLLIYVANWPASRSKVWNALLTARAIENMSYVCGVNRIGTDGYNIVYTGESQVIDAKGDMISNIEIDKEQICTISLSKNELDTFRNKFPVWKDADKFKIE
ncbi:MAG: amidohydrolase [Prevotella sp.]|jgi:predicted amidohydrolase|nr:amidohydrolase [Prevotella sp.]